MTFIFIFVSVLLINLTIKNIEAQDISSKNSLKDNVLIIIVDDLRHLVDKNVKLRNIQKLAANGVKFESSYAQQALCAPSRNSLLTGRRPDSIRLYDFYSYWRDSIGNYTTLPQFFIENGYDTYSVGKVFHPGKSSNFTDDFPYSWSELPYHPPTEKYKDAAVCKDKITKKLQSNLICPVDVKNQPGHSLPDLQSLSHAVNIIQDRRNKSRPFFLAVGFHKPHIPLKFPEEYSDRVPLHKLRPPKHPDIPADLPTVSWHPWTDIRKRDDIARLNISFPFGTMPHNWTMKIKQSYFAAALYVDDLIGSLMKHVDLKNTVVVLTSDHVFLVGLYLDIFPPDIFPLGTMSQKWSMKIIPSYFAATVYVGRIGSLMQKVDLKNTVVILTSNHGWSLGENGLWAKYSNFDVALKVPLIFHIPGMKPNTITTPVELIDIFPTLAEIAGLDKNIPKCGKNNQIDLCFEGKSLVNLMYRSKNDIQEDNFAISQYPRPSVYPNKKSDKPRLKDIKIMGYSIKTSQFRYTEWVSFNNTVFTKDWNKIYGLELYDHTTDSSEAHNVAYKRKYRHIRKYLSKLLRGSI